MGRASEDDKQYEGLRKKGMSKQRAAGREGGKKSS